MTETQRGKIDQMLQQNATLLEILSEKDVVSQSRWETQSGFADYFNRDKIQEMLGYIVNATTQVEGKDSAETHRLGHIVPFVATEIFNAEIPAVTKEFFYRAIDSPKPAVDQSTETELDDVQFEKSQDDDQQQQQPKEAQPDNEIFVLLLEVLDTEPGTDVNAVLAGYFEKIFQVLVGAYPRETYQALYSSPQGQTALKQMVKHSEMNQSISSVLEKCLNFSESIMTDQEQLKAALDFREQLIETLVSASLQSPCNSNALQVLKGLQQEVFEILLRDDIIEQLQSSESLQCLDLVTDMILKLTSFHSGKQKVQCVVQSQLDNLTNTRFDNQTSYYRLKACEMILQALKLEVTLDLKGIAQQLVYCFEKYPLQDCLLQKVAQILIGYLSTDEENEEMLMHLLFSTDFVKLMVKGTSMTHMYQLGFRLKELAQLSEHVSEFLDELVEGWPGYLESLQKYMKGLEGSLYEDPRNSQHDQLSNLLGLKVSPDKETEAEQLRVKDDGDFGMPVMQADEPTTQDDFDRLMLPQLEFECDKPLSIPIHNELSNLELGQDAPSQEEDLALMFYSSNGRENKNKRAWQDGIDLEENEDKPICLKIKLESSSGSEDHEGPGNLDTQVPAVKGEAENPQFYGSVYWKIEETQDLAELLSDYN